MRENEGFLSDLAANSRIGNYRPTWNNTRLVGPDIHILISSFLLILLPSAWFVVNQLPLYGSMFKVAVVEIVFIGSMCLDLYTLVDCGTSDSGIIPKSTHTVNMRYKYYIDPVQPGHDMIKLKVCRTCNIVRPPRSFHCKKCDSCIEVHDHHCPWTGTCIGRRTHRKFITFLAATCSHGIVATLLGIYPLWLNWNEPITNVMKLSSYILLAYSVLIMLLMFNFALYHLYMATKNITTNESLRGAYKRKSNPFDLGFSRNWQLFVEKYPRTPSSIFDLHKSLVEDEEAFYHSILARYGKLVCRRVTSQDADGNMDKDEGGEFIDYNNNGEIKMMMLDDHISLDGNEEKV